MCRIMHAYKRSPSTLRRESRGSPGVENTLNRCPIVARLPTAIGALLRSSEEGMSALHCHGQHILCLLTCLSRYYPLTKSPLDPQHPSCNASTNAPIMNMRECLRSDVIFRDTVRPQSNF